MGNIIDNLNDNELFALVKQDHEEAFTLLYHRYWKKMLCKAMFKLQSDFDAEEVVQDVFIDIWNTRSRIIIQNSFHTYISAILRFKIMAKMAMNVKLAHNNVEEINESHVIDDSTQQWLNFCDLQSEIEISIKELPDKCQLIFRMSRESGLTDKQIAIDLGLSQKTVEAHISRALRSLRISIGQFLSFL